MKGHLLVTEPAPFRLPGAVAPIATQLDGGGLLTGGTLDVDDTSRAVDPTVIDDIKRALSVALPSTADLNVMNAWCCFRPAHPDGLPVVDRVPGTTNAWMSTGHFRTGILMAPAAGDALAAWMGTGRRPDAIEHLRAARPGIVGDDFGALR